MFVTTLEEMTEIVDNNKRLHWVGWDVIEWVARPAGQFSPNGLRRNGRWGIVKRRIIPDRNGWEVPNGWVTSL